MWSNGNEKEPLRVRIRLGTRTVAGLFPSEIIQRIVRQSYGRFRACYESALERRPGLKGRVVVTFVIGLDGKVASANGHGSSTPDVSMVDCVLREFRGLAFPPPERKSVTVILPIDFQPPEGAASVPSAALR